MISRFFTAAIVLSSAVHAAIVLTAPDATRSIGQRAARPVAVQSRQLYAVLALAPTTTGSMSPSISPISAAATQAASPSNHRAPLQRGALAARFEQAPGATADEAIEPPVKPTPLNYPILVLPPDDDPHRIGLVRLLLVVSSDGKVAQVIVAASTMSQDYVDRVTKSFEEMRFHPSTLRGMPHTGWYEVVVNFDFEPQGATSL